MQRIIPRKDLAKYGIPFCNVHLLRLEKAGLFPRRVRLGGGGRVGYFETELDDYLNRLAAARDRAPAP